MKKYPKIGIRPTIDGRQGGVRESLEEKTMNLAKAVAELQMEPSDVWLKGLLVRRSLNVRGQEPLSLSLHAGVTVPKQWI